MRPVMVFGSCANQRQRADSDRDLAVHAGRALSGGDKIALIEALAGAFGRAVDLVDLHTCGEPLLGEILDHGRLVRSEEHTSELQSLMRISYAVFCLKKKTVNYKQTRTSRQKQQ